MLQPGDTVRLNEQSYASAKQRNRKGVVVGRSRVKGKLRVRWNGLKRPQIVQEALLLLDREERPVSREIVIGTIDQELERLRDARFERHLKWPREVPLKAYQGTVISKERPRLDSDVARIVGLLALTIAISGACFAFLPR